MGPPSPSVSPPDRVENARTSHRRRGGTSHGRNIEISPHVSSEGRVRSVVPVVVQMTPWAKILVCPVASRQVQEKNQHARSGDGAAYPLSEHRVQ